MNNGILSKILIFAAGAATGAAVAWKVTKTKCEKIAQEEIESVKKTYGDIVDAINNIPESYNMTREEFDEFMEPDTPSEEEKTEYRNIVKEYAEGGETSMDVGTKPYMITYDEFGDIDEYDTCTLTYYADGVLVDNWGSVIEDISNTVGDDFDNHFDEDEDEPDTVYVRNKRLKTDYEINRDVSAYADLKDQI